MTSIWTSRVPHRLWLRLKFVENSVAVDRRRPLDPREIRRSLRRQPKTPRGQRVVNKVAATARRLLSAKPAHSVRIAAIANAAGLPRGGVLLQFPDGMGDGIDRRPHEEEESSPRV